MHLCKQRKVYLVVLLSFIGIFMVTIHKEPYEKIIYLVNNTLAERFFREEPCACMERCLTASDDEWFMKVFREDIPPLLSVENNELSGDIFKWWQRLQSKSQANYSQVIEELFAIIPGEEHYRDSGPHRCRTCAVVGNSGNLIGSHYGPLIDNNDFVMRMNKAPIEGFENDVGFRTTHRIMYPESAIHLDNSTHLVLFPFKILDIQWITSALSTGTIKRTRFKVIDKIQANKDYVMVMHPAFMHYVHTSWLKSKSPKAYPSTGFLALMFALHVCDEVNVFGFGANSKGIWHHYFEKIPKMFRHTGKHRGGAEYSIILKLHQKNKITLYPGW